MQEALRPGFEDPGSNEGIQRIIHGSLIGSSTVDEPFVRSFESDTSNQPPGKLARDHTPARRDGTDCSVTDSSRRRRLAWRKAMHAGNGSTPGPSMPIGDARFGECSANAWDPKAMRLLRVNRSERNWKADRHGRLEDDLRAKRRRT